MARKLEAIPAYPLAWPAGWQRTSDHQRHRSELETVECTCHKVFPDMRGSRLVGRARDPRCPLHGESEAVVAARCAHGETAGWCGVRGCAHWRCPTCGSGCRGRTPETLCLDRWHDRSPEGGPIKRWELRLVPRR